MTYLGWPIASVLSWTGWLLAASFLIIRGERRARDIALFALALAFAIYAGQPDALTILGLGLVIFLAVFFLARRFVLGNSASILRPLFDLVVAAVAGTALAAPLLLPGLQVLGRSIRNLGGGALGGRKAISILNLAHFLVPTAQGRSLNGVAYVAIILMIFAIASIGCRWKQPEVPAFAALALTMGALAFSQPLISMLASTPGLEAVRWPRATVLVSFSIAILAGLGLDLLLRLSEDRALSRTIGASLLGIAGLLLGFWLADGWHSQPVQTPTWFHGLEWAVTAVVIGLATIMLLRNRRTRLVRRDLGRSHGLHSPTTWSALVLLVCMTAYLAAAGSPLWTSSPSYLPVTRAEIALERAVGSSLVGFGSAQCLPNAGLGIEQNVNVILRVRELAVYDPMLPVSYFHSWAEVTGRPAITAGYPALSTYCPPITSAAIARIYGVGFVLEAHGSPGPAGAIFDKEVGNEDLYRIPNSSAATLIPVASIDSTQSASATLAITYPTPASWKLTTHSEVVDSLRLRLTDTPGWHATIDGRPLKLTSYKQVMLQARIPAGTHGVVLSYWPQSFTVGIVFALCSLASLTLALFTASLRQRRRRASRRLMDEP